MTPGRDTCGGDSGGPLFRSEDGVLKLVGLTSYGAFNPNDRLKCGGKGSVGVYTHVLSYMEYIEGVTGLSFNELTSSEFRHQAGYVVSALSTNSLAKSMVPLLVASAIFMFKV
ncbi:hypothetical protein K7432_006593 [Basidiobolus ranarum]|uniref:Peptidase S1 domain-containing protein n=1 Tax=Basidiobolus ranarum TaxID=34480 RepID=A0ABR2W1D0_9FUNG